MDQVKEQLQKNTAILDPYAAMVPVLVDGAQKAGVNPGLLLAGILSVLMLILLLLQGWTILLTTVTVLFPAVHSIRAIESEGKDDDKIWLTYWMVFGVFNVAETFFGFVFYFIPYWEWIRLVLFIWLLVPQFNGSKYLYDNVVRKLLNDNKELIQKWINKATSAAEAAKKEGLAQASAAASDPTLLAKAASTAAQAQAQVQNLAQEEEDAPAPAE